MKTPIHYILFGFLTLLSISSCTDHEAEIDLNNCVRTRIVSVGTDAAIIDILLLPPLYNEAFKDSIKPSIMANGQSALTLSSSGSSQIIEEDGKSWYRFNLSNLKPNTTYEFTVSARIFLGSGKDRLLWDKYTSLTPTDNTFSTLVNAHPVDLGLSVLWGDSDLGMNLGEYSTLLQYNWTVNPISGLPPYTNISGTNEDPVTAILGDGWRMPTAAEIQELIDNCNWENWNYYKIATGEIIIHFKKVSGKGNFSKASINLYPYKNQNTLDYIGTFWSATVSNENTGTDTFKVDCLWFNKDGQSIQPMPYTTSTIYQIRPVKDR